MAAETTSTPAKTPRKRGGITQRKGTPNPAVAAVADKIGADTVDQVALDTAAVAGAEAAAEADGLVPVSVVPAAEPVDDSDPEPDPEPAAPAELSQATVQTISPAAAPAPRQTREEKRDDAKRAKEAAQTQSPSTKRLGPIGTKMPGAEHVKVHKRMPNGTLGWVGDYRAADIAMSQDMESFLAAHALGVHGPGVYHLTGVDARGGIMDGGPITLLGPELQGPATAAPTVVQQMGELHDLQQKMKPPVDNSMNALLQSVLTQAMTPSPTVNPIEQMGQLMDLQTKLKTDADGPKADNGGTTAAIIGAITTILTTMLPLLLQKKEDPLMAILLAKMLEDSGSSNMPMPPPLAPPDPLAPIMPLLTMMIENMKPQEGANSANEAVMNLLMAERMKPQDMVTMMTELRGGGGSEGVKKTIEDMGFLMNAAQGMQNLGGGGGSGWAESLGQIATSIFGNPRMNAAMANAIQARTGGATVTTPAAGTRTLPAGSSEEAAVIRERQRVHAQRLKIQEDALAAERLQLEEETAQDPMQHRPRIRPVQPHVTPAPAAAAPPAEAASDPQGAPKAPELPPEIVEYVNTITLAEDDASLCQGVITLIQYLGHQEAWAKFANTVAILIQGNEKAKALGLLHSFFEELRRAGYLDEVFLTRIMNTLNTHFDAIVAAARPEEAEASVPASGEEAGPDGDGDGDGEGDYPPGDGLTDGLPEGFDPDGVGGLEEDPDPET